MVLDNVYSGGFLALQATIFHQLLIYKCGEPLISFPEHGSNPFNPIRVVHWLIYRNSTRNPISEQRSDAIGKKPSINKY